MPYEHILGRLRGLVPHPQRPNAWRAYCPYHKGGQERRRSLSLWIGRDGRLMIGCWSCGAENKKNILEAIGCTMSDLFPERDDTSTAPISRPRVVDRFDYCDEHGTVLYQQWRYEPKSFCLHRMEDGKPKPGLGNIRRVLYRLPDLLAAPPRLPIAIAEGERKVNALWEWGIPATCCAGGVGMGWVDAYSQWLTQHCHRRTFLVFPDHDAPGWRHADTVIGSLIRHQAEAIKLVLLPGLLEKEDILDWKRKGGTTKQLLEAIAQSPRYSKG